jgi:hypothetical protein
MRYFDELLARHMRGEVTPSPEVRRLAEQFIYGRREQQGLA